MQFFLGVLSFKIHIGVFGMINKWKYSACIRELRNAHQKIPHKILGSVVKFWL